MLAWMLSVLLLGAGFDGWTVDGPGQLKPSDPAFLGVRYTSADHAPLTLVPPAPVALPEGTTRVRFWYARTAGDFDLRLQLRDAAGREHLEPVLTSGPTFPGIRRMYMADWSVWRQAESRRLRPLAEVAERVVAERRDELEQALWPEPLTLTGIELVPANQRRDNEAHSFADEITAGIGEVWLTAFDSIDYSGLEAQRNWFYAGRWRWGRDAPLWLFPDDLTRRSGKLTWSVEVTRGYQGPVVFRQTGEATQDRSNPVRLWQEKLELPALPPGRYQVTTRTWAPDGTFDQLRTADLFIVFGPSELSTAAAPAVWSTGQPNHVFPSEAKQAKLVLASNETHGCRITVVDWLQRPAMRQEFAPAQRFELTVPVVTESTDYTATAELLEGRRVVDLRTLHFGVASAPTPLQPLPDGLPTRDELLWSHQPVFLAEHFGSQLTTDLVNDPMTPEKMAKFDEWLEQAAGYGFKLVSYYLGWGEVEPLPGVYRWHELDRRVDEATRLGLKMFLTPAQWGSDEEFPRWLTFQPMLDQFGQIAVPQSSRFPHPTFYDPAKRSGQDGYLQAIARRYRGNPTVIGYRTKPATYVESNKPEFTRSDYAPTFQQAYDEWRRALQLKPEPLAPLFMVPATSPARSGVDLSETWHRFMQFRTETYRRSVSDILGAIREVDPVRQIHVYRSATSNAPEAAIPLLKDGAEFHDEGGPMYFQRALESMCLQAGIPYTNEGHQFTPPSLAMVDSGFFYGSIYDRGFMWLYRWNIGRDDDPRFKGLPAALAHVRDSRGAMSQWVAGRGDEPQVLVFGSRVDKHDFARQGFYTYITGLDTFTALFSYHQVPAHFADEYTDWVDLGRFPIVFAQGEVLTEHAMDRLVKFAEAGGKLVLLGDCGKYCAEQPDARDRLSQRLGQRPNVRRLALPDQPAPAPGAAANAGLAFEPKVLDEVLQWAGAKRLVQAASAAFETLRKSGAGGAVHVAVFRRWPGNYNNIWYDAKALKTYGRQGTKVTVTVPNGRYHLTEYHREAKDFGVVEARGGAVTFDVAPETAGELRLYRLDPLR